MQFTRQIGSYYDTYTWAFGSYYFVIILEVLFIVSALLFSLPPGHNSDPGSHSRLFSPLPNTVRALHFYREKSPALSSSIDSRRIVRNTSQIFFCSIFCAEKKHIYMFWWNWCRTYPASQNNKNFEPTCYIENSEEHSLSHIRIRIRTWAYMLWWS